ncbi:MAG: hypothetical protein PHI06_06910 [Desulfobulbaceae bacterium]|nr:hypothetical protein [Desulfobulbaceae bacterium]
MSDTSLQNKARLRGSCITPHGTFRFAVHRPVFTVSNLRQEDSLALLGRFADGMPHENSRNFPKGEVCEPAADPIYEIANPFPFRGATFIPQSWAESKVDHPERIALPAAGAVSMTGFFTKMKGCAISPKEYADLFAELPAVVRLALAANSTDAADLVVLADQSCELLYGLHDRNPLGLRYRRDEQGQAHAVIHDHTLFEVVVNNPHLPDVYKEAMVLKPGVQGGSEIVGDWRSEDSHVFEYLRRNSYIPWGHYAANMANDAIRYRADDLLPGDMAGMRHLYYQRTFCRLAADLDLDLPATGRSLSVVELETLRHDILRRIGEVDVAQVSFSATLWGWNYGFDCAANGYRLHASHQMIHQQFSLLPSAIPASESGDGKGVAANFQPYSCGDQICDAITVYAEQTGSSFFADYLAAIRGNTRLDGRRDIESSLIVHEDTHIILFVPKAKVSQWELQMMTVQPVGNILEADQATRQALDSGIFIALRVLSGLGAQMVTSIEYPKRFGVEIDQRLLYSFLPKLPFAPGAFSEAQLRFICGHYPEDFARACRRQLAVYRQEARG